MVIFYFTLPMYILAATYEKRTDVYNSIGIAQSISRLAYRMDSREIRVLFSTGALSSYPVSTRNSSGSEVIRS
jgi:hypothetical protein